MVKDKKVLKQKKVVNEDMGQVKNLIILLLIVIVLCTGVYFLTDKLISKEQKNDTTKTEVDIDYDTAILGTMFNRPESEYYVILYSNENDGSLYNTLLTKYRSSDNYIKTYYIDLDKTSNKKALTDKLNKKPNNSNEVSVTGPTLYKIKSGKVTNCYTDYDTIKDILK